MLAFLGGITFEAIERRAGLSALACLTIIARKASEERDSEYAFEVGYWICRMLLLCGEELMRHGIANPIYQLYEIFILPLTTFNYLHHTYRGLSYLSLIGRVSDRLWHLEGVSPHRLSKSEKLQYEQKILGWDYGLDNLNLFLPAKIAVDQVLIESDAFLKYWEAQLNVRKWADSGKWYENIKTFNEHKRTDDLCKGNTP